MTDPRNIGAYSSYGLHYGKRRRLQIRTVGPYSARSAANFLSTPSRSQMTMSRALRSRSEEARYKRIVTAGQLSYLIKKPVSDGHAGSKQKQTSSRGEITRRDASGSRDTESRVILFRFESSNLAMGILH